MDNFYDMLRVRRDATRDEIKMAYRHQMKLNHPDRISGMEESERTIAEAIAKDAGRAYQVLVEPKARAKYDRQLDDFERRSAPAPEQTAPEQASDAASQSPSQPRRTMNFSQAAGARPGGRFDINPENWSWFAPASPASDDAPKKGSKGRVIALRALGIASWLAWAAVSMYWWHGPLMAVNTATDQPTWWATGLIVHAIATVLALTGWIWKKPALIIGAIALALCTASVVTNSEAFTQVAFWLAVAAPLGSVAGSVLTTTMGLLPGIAMRRKDDQLIDSTQFVTVGSHSIGQRHPDIAALISALAAAFKGRDGVRVVVLPDRVSSVQVKAQAVVTVGADVHLISIPPLGDQGFEISGRSISASGATLRTVVLDEAEDIRRFCGKKVGKIYPYVVPTRIGSLQAQELGKVTFASLDDAIRLIGERSTKGLDKPNAAARHSSFRAMSRLLTEREA